MPKITHKGVTYDVPNDLAPVITDLQTRADTAEGERDQYKGQIDILTKERDEHQQRADSLESNPVDVDKLVDERMEIVERAKPFLPEGYDVKGKSNHQLRADAIASHMNDDAWKTRSESEVLGAFGVLPKPSQSQAQPNQTVNVQMGRSALNRQYSGRGDSANEPTDVRSAYANRGYGSARERAKRSSS